MPSRRRFLRVAAAGAAIALAGCSGGDESETATPVRTDGPVAVGPGGSMTFDPVAVEVSAGETVEWRFDSSGHNVSARPDASGRVSLPEGADPFSSYEGDDHYRIAEVGATFEHAFEVPGEYVYVCTPHVMQGMIGRVVVTE